MKKTMNCLVIFFTFFFISGCIIPIPYVTFKSRDIESKSKDFSYDVPRVISALSETLTAQKFTIDNIQPESGVLTASSNMTMVDKGISLNPIKPAIGLSATFITLRLTAQAKKISSKKTNLTIEIDYQSDDVSMLIDKIFQVLETRLPGKSKKK